MVDSLDYKDINFPVCKTDQNKIEKKNDFASIYSILKMVRFTLFIYQSKNLKIVWIWYWYHKIINFIMYIWNILIDLCLIRQSIKLKTTFLDTVYNALVMKGFYQNIKKCV